MKKTTDLQGCWQTPKYLPYIQPALTDEIIQEAETKMGYKLPGEYIQLLKTQNGGYIRYTLKDTPHSQIAGIGPYFPSITDFEWLSEYEGAVSFELNGLFPFDGDGHWNICLDYRKNKVEPEVTYIDTESDYEKPIAKTFAAYLGLLEIETDNEFVIETDAAIEDAIERISKIAAITFEEPDHFAHGYPIYRSKYDDSWVWIRTNRVPAAFIREDDDRYEELKAQMQATSVRHPEVPADYLFISVSDEVQREQLLGKLREGGVRVRELKDYFDNI
jgi:hypothetical protein